MGESSMGRLIKASVINDIGKIRKSNQDNFIFNGMITGVEHNHCQLNHSVMLDSTNKFLVGVFDGMGGESNGDLAALISAKMFLELENENIVELCHEKISEYYSKANDAVCDECKKLKSRMGTTAATILFTEHLAHISNIGDSRIYLVRDSKILQLSRDHTENQRLIENVSNNSVKKSRLTQYLGIFSHEYIIEPFMTFLETRLNDVYLICSDGITDMLSDSEIELILLENDDVHQISKLLLDKAISNGGVDNTTAIVCKVIE
jgi:PPM family protein phosphatase